MDGFTWVDGNNNYKFNYTCMEITNYNGVVLPKISPLSLEFGGMTTVGRELTIPNGDARPFLPLFKGQSGVYMDTFGCVIHSHNKAKKTFLKAIYNIIVDFADRDLVVLSGTKPRVGNSGEKVLATAQAIGLPSYKFENFDLKSRDPKHTEEYYYSYKRTSEAQKDADKNKEEYEIVGEWVGRENWEEASKYGILQLYVNAWHRDAKGEYYNPNGKYNHAVIMANYPTRQLSDTYEPELKTLRSWNDAYYWALKINIIKKHMSKPKIDNNTLVQEVTKSGQFGLFLDNKIIVGGAGEVLATFYMRNNGDTKGKTRALTLDQWNMFDKYNLKMEKI